MLVGITGGTGFIGKKLVERHLADGDVVRVLTRKKELALSPAVQLVSGDLGDPSASLSPFAEGLDVLYHCAGEIRDPGRMRDVHVLGTERLIAAARGNIGHWVQLSSVGVYGPHASGVITEETNVAPRGPYEETKALSDERVLEAGGAGAFHVSVLRPSIVFGSTMTNRSLFQMIAMIDRGLFFFIGKPGASANYVHVDNVVEALVLCAKTSAARGRVYNLSDYRTLEEFVFAIADALGKPPPRVRLPEKAVRRAASLAKRLPRFPLTEERVDALTNRSWYSIRRIVHDLAYAHPRSMEQGISELVSGRRL